MKQLSHEAYENMKTEVTATSRVEQVADDKGFYRFYTFAELCCLDLSCHHATDVTMFVYIMGSQVAAFLSVVSPTSFVRPRVLLRLLSSLQFWYMLDILVKRWEDNAKLPQTAINCHKLPQCLYRTCRKAELVEEPGPDFPPTVAPTC